MISNPVWYDYFRNNTYKWWASHLIQEPLYKEMLSIQGPIFFVHGTEDESVPIESADRLVKEFKKAGKENLTYLRLEGDDHSLQPVPEIDVDDEAVDWLKELFSDLDKWQKRSFSHVSLFRFPLTGKKL